MKYTERHGLSEQTFASLKQASAFSIVRFVTVDRLSQEYMNRFHDGRCGDLQHSATCTCTLNGLRPTKN